MAITDVLRGLLGGAGGAFAGYNLQQQREQERLERETERLERQEATRRQQEQADRLFNMQVQQAVAEGILSPTEYVEYAKPSDFLRGEAIGMQRPAAGADMSSILADQPIGMQRQASSRRSEIASALSAEARDGRMAGGAMVAPGQTYPAIDRVLAEAEPTPRAEDIGTRDTERPARGLDRVLEITPEDIAGRFERAPMQGSWTGGRGTFEGLDGQMYRATTPEERAVREEDALRRQILLQNQIQTEYRRNLVEDIEGLTDAEIAEFILTGRVSKFAPRDGGDSLADRLEKFRAGVGQLATAADPITGERKLSDEQLRTAIGNLAIAQGIPSEFVKGMILELAPLGGGGGGDGGDDGGGDGDTDLLDPILARKAERKETEEQRLLNERKARTRFNTLLNALEVKSFYGEALTPDVEEDIRMEIADIDSNFGFIQEDPARVARILRGS